MVELFFRRSIPTRVEPCPTGPGWHVRLDRKSSYRKIEDRAERAARRIADAKWEQDWAQEHPADEPVERNPDQPTRLPELWAPCTEPGARPSPNGRARRLTLE